MKLKEYIEVLNQMIEKDPSLLKFEVITSIDDEGNGFNPVNYYPAIGKYNRKNREFAAENSETHNAICLN